MQGYEEMFHSKRHDKILIKGDPRMGKTTLLKKVGWDWARGVFRLYPMVFFVFLKFVQPGDSIENVIIEQNPELEGLGVSEEKLHRILKRFSDKCLLILDGLDEHGLGENDDVLKIIQNQNLINCGVIISSRPHSTRTIELHCRQVIRVNGFNQKEAKRFVSNFFENGKKVNQIMLFKPSDSREIFPIQKCPILLSFFCFLVAEQEINLLDRTISIGDIYTRLVKCLYKKYTIRKDIAYEAADFDGTMRFVEQLALRTLISNNPLLQRREVLRVVGEFAFDYGLFAGHEDIRLCGDPTADICVTYPHRSLEEFFGSFGFLQALNKGQSIDYLLGLYCKKPIFMVNPLVLRFCLWFLSSSSFDISKRDKCYDKLTSYAAERIDTNILNPIEIGIRYPAIDMLTSERLGRSTIHFFRDTLNKCKLTATLHLHDESRENKLRHLEVADNFLGLMDIDFTDRLTKIIIGPDSFKLKDVNNNSLILSIVAEYNPLRTINLLLQKNKEILRNSQRNPQIYAIIDTSSRTKCDITPLLSKYIKELHIVSYFKIHLLTTFGEFPDCPVLTYLRIIGHHIHGTIPFVLRRAIHRGKLPCLRRVTLMECCRKSLRSDWPDDVEISVKFGKNHLACSVCLSEQDSK